ncbi:hypothetical protein ACFZDJ_01600 [Streptomyces sp. NPDC007896]|uniref:hypothetical protein n=1 Tax=Streptomyces sp. NPDC007896 TaxID=3364784 RepID=UPI0036E4F60C
MGIGIVMAVAVLAAFKAAWDQYSHESFALLCVCAVIGVMAAAKHSELSRQAKLAGTPPGPTDTGQGCLFWIAWKVGGIAALALLFAVWDEWF